MCINIHTYTSSVLPRILLRRSGRVCICHVHKQHIQMFNIIICTCQCVPPLFPSQVAQGTLCKTRGFNSSLTKAIPSCTSVSGPGFFQRSCGWVELPATQQYKPIRLPSNAKFCHQNVCMSLHACSIQTTEDAENVEIAKSTQAGDQKQKYNLEWPIK